MKLPDHLRPGRPEPMGSLARDGGVNFAVFSEHAQRIELCLFDTDGVRELRRYDLHGPDDGVFHGDSIEVKHSNEYHPPKPGESPHEKYKTLIRPSAP